MTLSLVEATRGDQNRVKLANLLDDVDQMVPAGYTESSWSEAAKLRHDLYTEDEEGKPGARVRYEDLQDDPYFQEYVTLISRLDDALEQFGMSRSPLTTSL